MKKLICLTAICLLLAGCSGKQPSLAQTLPAPEPATKPVVSTSWVKPLPSAVHLDDLTDCTLNVSLSQGDVYTDADGVNRMKLTVYEYDLYGMADIAALRSGDTITISGEDVAVKSVTRDEFGIVEINGGMDAGGYSLSTNDDTTYHQLLENDAGDYHPVGTLTLRVSQDFRFNDESNPEQTPQIFTCSDFLDGNSRLDYFFTPRNTTIRVVNGAVTEMIRVFVP